MSGDARIIVAHEKHGPAYWDATTPQAWAASSLAILTKRWEDGWYSDPDEYDRQYREWHERAEAIVEARDTGFTAVGRDRHVRRIPRAWRLLDERSDHEYERVALEQLLRGGIEGV